MEENKEIEFVFLIEEERRAEAFRVEKRVQTEARRAEKAQQEAEAKKAEGADKTHTCQSIDTTFKVRNLTVSTVTRILRMDKGVTHYSVEGSDEDEYRTVFFQTKMMEASLRCHLKLRRAQVEVLSRRTQGAGFRSRDDCVVLVMPLSNDVFMTGDGRAVLKHHPDNQVLIDYSQRLDRLAMGENRFEVLLEISAVSNMKSMEATEQEDVVAVSARFFHDGQGEAIGNAFGALDEITNLCHGARVRNHHAIEGRRRAIEAGARACAAPVDADSLAHPAGEQEAMDAAGGKGSSGKEDEGEKVGGGNTEENATEEELLGPNCPMLVGPSEDGGLMVNPRLKINPSGHNYLRQWGIAVDESGKLLCKGDEDGGDEDLTSESDAADLTTDNDQNPTTTRKTCDKEDSQDMNHASMSGQGKE